MKGCHFFGQMAVLFCLAKLKERQTSTFLHLNSDWSPKYSTWEPEANILDERLIQMFNRRHTSLQEIQVPLKVALLVAVTY